MPQNQKSGQSRVDLANAPFPLMKTKPALVSALILLFLPGFLIADHRLGIWNIEKLSTRELRGFPELKGANSLQPRTDVELDQIAAYIEDTLNVDALVVTEIDADDTESGTAFKPRSVQLTHIAEAMGSQWKYLLGRSGGDLRIGFVYNSDRIGLKRIVELPAPEFEVQGDDVFDRDPLLLWITLKKENGDDGADILLVGLHLKSGQDYKHNHLAAVAKLVGDLKTPAVREGLGLPRTQSGENDLIVLGDLNDSSHDDNGFRFIFTYLESQGFRHMGSTLNPYPETRVNGSQIDHMFLSADIFNDAYVLESFAVHGVPDTEAARRDYRQVFSDHFPLTIDLRSIEDDDD